jgi:predicted CoA-substrate-specific enzyme activase
MIAAGIDIGSSTAKSVLIENGNVIAAAVLPIALDFTEAAEKILNHSMESIGVTKAQIGFTVVTGYGRRSATFGDKIVTEILCGATGAKYVSSRIRTVIDIGGQDTKIIRLDDSGKIASFRMNDKCAAGTGRFLEVMARALSIDIDEIGSLAVESKKPCQISSICTVFAESEAITLRAKGESVSDVLAGIHKSVVSRVAAQGASVGYQEEIMLIGGVAKNIAIRKYMMEEIGFKIHFPEMPQVVVALGAAVIAENELRHKRPI